MKTLMTIAFLSFITITTSAVATQLPTSTPSVTVTSFKSFKIHRQGKGVTLSWQPATADVQEFVIERSYDGEFFETVCSVGCNGTSIHRFTDENVFPGYIHYRITAVNADGTSEASPVQMIRIVQRK
ncbi:fibronectin type III domain-containing protein [Flavisolibacter tropicus]|uniref:Fibronectin type-III domain-containing protein n=1 Tax=Flavisolibacter tropicus TaxID=1492898 RepID=A0A172TZI5_9BACT|nr:fibronectin type III domain-containing protein [Flavisolibacter tropicus]ANE52284.1 hypothetical protein SY85_19130 [Flavisolibacter tropicus]